MGKSKYRVAKSAFFFIFMVLIFLVTLSDQSSMGYLSSTMLTVKIILTLLLATCTAINGAYFIYNLLNYYEDVSKRSD